MPEGGSDYVWVLDPIDGTKSFITGDYDIFLLLMLSTFFLHVSIGENLDASRCRIEGSLFMEFPFIRSDSLLRNEEVGERGRCGADFDTMCIQSLKRS